MGYKLVVITVDDPNEAIRKTTEKLKISGIDYMLSTEGNIKRTVEICRVFKPGINVNNYPIGGDSYVAVYMFISSKSKDLSNLFKDKEGEIAELDITGLRTDGVTSVAHLFSKLSLDSLDISHLNMRSVKDMQFMFYRATIKELNITGIDTSNCTDMSQMFCQFKGHITGLETLNTSRVENMMGMFASAELYMSDGTPCKRFKVNVIDTSSATDMSYMFYKLEVDEIDLDGINTIKCTDMSYLFCETKARIVGLENLNTSNVKNMMGMFVGTEFKGKLDLGSFDTSKVEYMMNVFQYAKIEHLDISKFCFSNLGPTAGMFYSAKIKILDLPSFEGLHLSTDIGTYLQAMFMDAVIGKCTIRDLVIYIDDRAAWKAYAGLDYNMFLGASFEELSLIDCFIEYKECPECYGYEASRRAYSILRGGFYKKIITNSIRIADHFRRNNLQDIRQYIQIKCSDCFGDVEYIDNNEIYYYDNAAIAVYECKSCHKVTIIHYNDKCNYTLLLYDWCKKCAKQDYCETKKYCDTIVKRQ